MSDWRLENGTLLHLGRVFWLLTVSTPKWLYGALDALVVASHCLLIRGAGNDLARGNQNSFGCRPALKPTLSVTIWQIRAQSPANANANDGRGRRRARGGERGQVCFLHGFGP
jgi:hypothetical protein